MTAAADPAARRRAQSGFALYDAANSAFVTVVVTAVGGPFLTALAEAAAGADGRLHGLRAGSLFPLAVTASVVLQVLLLPVLGAAADDRTGKRRLLVRGTQAGALATLLLAVSPAGAPLVGLGLFVVANVALGLAILAYNAHLADVAEPHERDRVSARGFAVGYAGGGLVLAVSLGLLSLPGLERGTAVRLAIGLSGLVWALLGAVAVRRLDAAPVRRAAPDEEEGLAEARHPLRALRTAVRELRRLPLTLRYLVAFLLFNDAVQAVIALSTVVLTQELYVARGREADEATGFLLSLVLLIQVVAVPGALLSARLAARYGAKRVLLGTLVLWSGVLLYAVLGLETTTQALAMGVVIALVLGGSQALARSLYSRMVPDGRQASFFGFYELAERGTAWIGTLVFAVVFEVTGSYRGAFSSLLVLFVAGGLLLALTDTDEAERRAAAQDRAEGSTEGRKRSA